ncbi:MAG: ribosome maturation factor RimM [Mycoplasmatales bacterium]
MKIIGKIVNTQGINGELRILSNSDFKDIRFKVGNELFIGEKKVIVSNYRIHKNFDILKFEGFDNINEVTKFKGKDLMGVELKNSYLDKNEFFSEDIIGLKVIDIDTNEVIGTVKELRNYGSCNTLIIKNGDKKYNVPFLDEFIKEVDTNEFIKIKVIEGLLGWK